MTRELPVLGNHVRPFSTFFHDILDDGKNLVLSGSDLGRRVSFAEGDCAIFDGLEVDCDSEWSSEFVVSGIAAADGLGGVVYFVGNPVGAKLDGYIISK